MKQDTRKQTWTEIIWYLKSLSLKMPRKIVCCDTLSVSATSQDIVQTKEQMQVISAFLG